MIKSKLFNDEQLEFVLNNYKNIGNKELTEIINRKFNLNLTKNQVKGFKNNHKLDSGLDGRYKKGNIPMNKGKKWEEFMSEKGMTNSKKTTFKKGNIPANADPIGTEKWKKHNNRNDIGFLYVKVADGKRQNNWKQKHRLIWEEKYGPIPKGYKLIFKDGNREHIELSNLALVTNSQMLILNRNNLIYNNVEATETAITLAKYIDKVNKCKKK